MVERDLILTKASAAKKHLSQVIDKVNVGQETFLQNTDLQEIVMFNLQMAIQNCIDIAAHIISEEGFGVPGSTSEMFYKLEENGYLKAKLTEKMIKAVGLRNLIVYEYAKMGLKILHEIARKDIKDLDEYLKALFNKLSLNRNSERIPRSLLRG